MKVLSLAEIPLDPISEGLKVYIYPKAENTLHFAFDAPENNEAPFQLMEGFSYDYALNDSSFILEQNTIVSPHSRNNYLGTLQPNIFVGTLRVNVLHAKSRVYAGKFELEVRSIKASYRDDYRFMLEEITEKCTELLMQPDAPISQTYETNFDQDSQSAYQRFSFIRSICGTEEFQEAIHRITSNPVTRWQEDEAPSDIRRIRKIGNGELKQFTSSSSRIRIPQAHPLRSKNIKDVPTRILRKDKVDSPDTIENRFVKHALENFLWFSETISKILTEDTAEGREAISLSNQIRTLLDHSLFQKISRPHTLKLNSPVLQRREGYREVLRVWLMFDLAAKLIWEGGDDVYQAGKKDIAKLYEYWLFFKLYDIISDVYQLDKKKIGELITPEKEGLLLRLKSGSATHLSGIFKSDGKNLKVKFSYNRFFRGAKTYPSAESWTIPMQPDYTLTLWPEEFSEIDAEQNESIVHIHFDAKYKIDNLTQLIAQEPPKATEEGQQKERKYKNLDVLKMHAYKDAIRRTAGAYILYPGNKEQTFRGFHEILPGLGAFPLRPSRSNDGSFELASFLKEVNKHLADSGTQRAQHTKNRYDVHKVSPNA